MKILIITMSFWDVGGIQKYIRHLTLALDNLYGKENVDILCIADQLLPKSIGKYPKHVNICGRSKNFFTKIKFIWKCFLLVLRNKYDIIICSHVFLSPVAFLMKNIFGTKYISIAHGIDVDRKLSCLKRISIKNSYKVLTVSRFTQEILHIKQKIKQSKIIVLSPCILQSPNIADYREKSNMLRAKYNLNRNKVLLTVARYASVEKYKGYDTVINVLPNVIKKVPNVKYLLVGTGDDIPRIKKLAKDLGVEKNTIFTDFVPDEDLPYYYNLCDVFVMPSKREGFGIVFLEALALGKPVIAGNKDGSHEALLDGKLGILVDPNNMEELTNAIVNILKKKVDMHLLNEKYLKNTVQENFGFEIFLKKVKEIFNGLSNETFKKN